MKIAGFAFFALLAACARAANQQDAPCVREVNETKTVRFPGGNLTQIAASGSDIAATASWSREDGALFFRKTPCGVRFTGRIPARGYVLSAPVFHGGKCYVPSGFSASVVDMKEWPRFCGYLNPAFPKDGCTAFWTEGDKLYFTDGKQSFLVSGDGTDYAPVGVQPAKKTSSKKCFLADGTPVSIEGSAIAIGGERVEFAYDLSSVAASGDKAWVYTPRGGDVLPLDLSGDGLALFGKAINAGDIPKEEKYMTMGMQSASSILLHGGFAVADDAVFGIAKDGSWNLLMPRSRAASSAYADGNRVAVAQCGRVRVLNLEDPENITFRDYAPEWEHPMHITGAVLKDDTLFIAFTVDEIKGQDYIYVKPKRGWVAAIGMAGGKMLSYAEIPPCVDLAIERNALYATCINGAFAVIDASNPSKLAIHALREDLQDGASYKIKKHGPFHYLGNGQRILELDCTEPLSPKITKSYRRRLGSEAPSYDDFAFDGNRLYALAHGSIDIFDLDGEGISVPYDFGKKGARTEPLAAADPKLFDGHKPNATPPDGVTFRGGYFGNYFGASVLDWAKLDCGLYAVAYGEGGIILADAGGAFVGELPRSESGYVLLFAAETIARNDEILVKDGSGNCYALTLGDFVLRKAD